MTNTHHNSKPSKAKHLTIKERSQIEILLKQQYSNRQIAKALQRAPQTINNEIYRGTIEQRKKAKRRQKVYVYTIKKYCPDVSQRHYLSNRKRCGRKPKWLRNRSIIQQLDDLLLKKHCSPYVALVRLKKSGRFPEGDLPSVSTLYQWINRGFLDTKDIDLLEKTKRKPSQSDRSLRQNKRVLGESIEKRPKEIMDRETFGHWEIDTVIGTKNKEDPVLLTLVERKTRFKWLIKIDAKSAIAVQQAIDTVKQSLGNYLPLFFKTITSDNGSEFSSLASCLTHLVDVYFSHPYASYERGSSENRHKLIRRFIPKGTKLETISQYEITKIQQWMNDYERKILDALTPHEAFVREIARLNLALEKD